MQRGTWSKVWRTDPFSLFPFAMTRQGIRKQLTGGGWNDSFAANIACTQTAATCPVKLATAQSCFAAAQQIGMSQSVRVATTSGSSTDRPPGCSVSVNGTTASVFFNTNSASPACCGTTPAGVEGTQQSLVTLGLALDSTAGATITLTGPSRVWFGVGFNTHVMSNSPYTITVNGDGTVAERVLGDHVAGIVLNASIKVLSSAPHPTPPALVCFCVVQSAASAV